MRPRPDLIAELEHAVGSAAVVTDPDVVASHTVDWTGRFHGTTPAVIRPASVEEVAAVLAVCNAAGAAVVPQGGNTGLVGGSIPRAGELVLDLRRLDAIDAVDHEAAQVTVQAGVTLARLQAHVARDDWVYGVDLGARDTATIGGTIATNAGGVHVLRYGATRRQVVGVECVLADGRVIRRLDGLEKDNTGYDLADLVCGSEGTLAVVTAARLRLHPRPAHVVAALCAFDDLDAALAAVPILRHELEYANAIELFLDAGLALVCERLHLPAPFAGRHAAYVLVEAAARFDQTDALAYAVGECEDVADVAVATNAHAVGALWRYRDGHPEAINQLGAPHKLDVALPARTLGEFMRAVTARVTAIVPGATVWLFGHAADGNVHVNVTGVAPDDDRVTEVVLGFVAELGGSISAEHGIGTAKRRFVHLVRTPAELATYRAIKDALDPAGILNPHVLLPELDERGV